MSHTDDSLTHTYLDFRDAVDSPTAILRAHAADLYAAAEADEAAGLYTRSEMYRNRANGYSIAATLLMAKEVQNGVTFVILDNDTLDAFLEDRRNPRATSADIAAGAADLLGLVGQ